MVFGERNSGTNHINELLRLNIPAFEYSPGDRIGEYGFAYGWKHAFPQMLAAPPTTLAIGVFRDPEEWVKSMYDRPWHVAGKLRDLPFAEFIRSEWVAQVDELNFGVTREDSRLGAELQWDRHPLTGDRFTNICALRRAKNAGFLSLMRRFANCLLVRHEDVSEAPEKFVRWVSDAYGVARMPEFIPVTSRRGRSEEGQFQPAKRAPLDPEDRVFLWSQLDLQQEAQLGYRPEKTLETKPGQTR